MKRWSRLVLGLALAAAGCLAASEEDIKAEFGDHVAKANQCQEVAECAVAFPGCPLGCSVAVRADRKVDVERKARELIKEYERGGRACAYDCAAAGELACVAGRCGFKDGR